jgi:hypothetical protein
VTPTSAIEQARALPIHISNGEATSESLSQECVGVVSITKYRMDPNSTAHILGKGGIERKSGKIDVKCEVKLEQPTQVRADGVEFTELKRTSLGIREDSMPTECSFSNNEDSMLRNESPTKTPPPHDSAQILMVIPEAVVEIKAEASREKPAETNNVEPPSSFGRRDIQNKINTTICDQPPKIGHGNGPKENTPIMFEKRTAQPTSFIPTTIMENTIASTTNVPVNTTSVSAGPPTTQDAGRKGLRRRFGSRLKLGFSWIRRINKRS